MQYNEWLFNSDATTFAVTTGGGGGGETNTSSGTTTAQAPAEGSSGGGGIMGGGAFGFTTILMYGGLIFALYFFMIRPQRKRDKDMKALQSAIGVGDNVVTSSGMYGVVTVVGEDCFVVEFGTNKGVRVPVRKADILGIKTPNINPAPKETA